MTAPAPQFLIDAAAQWSARLQNTEKAMVDPDQFGQAVIQGLLTELQQNPIIGHVFRFRLSTGHAIRITLEMCVTEPENPSDEENNYAGS